jgi:protein-L-isoaspartate(D-aspartate) O-methyltransferase
VIELKTRRQVFAEDIQTCCNLQTPALVNALAAVPREAFLGPGPWLIIGEGDMGRGARRTPDDDPRHVYHNVAIAIDPERQLFNGAPGVIASAIDALALRPGDHVLHIGAGLGYYSALIAQTVGPTGRVIALEIDETLAAGARQNLSALPWVEVRQGNAVDPLVERLDAILVNAGVTHPLDTWLDALAPHGRMVLPLTATFSLMGPIGKGPMLLLSGPAADGSFDVRPVTIVAIYSAVGLRDDTLNEALGKALMKAPFAALKRLRRDPHDAEPSCWLHTAGCCFSTASRAPDR